MPKLVDWNILKAMGLWNESYIPADSLYSPKSYKNFQNLN